MIASNTIRLTTEQQQLVMDHYPLILQAARTLWNHTNKLVPLEDLRYYAILGACNAAVHFDQSLGFKFSTLVYKCSHRRMSQYIRMFTTHKKTECMLPLSRISEVVRVNPVEEYDNIELLQYIQQALPVRWWRLLVFYYQDGMTYKQIGRQYGISPQAVGRTIRLAIRRARKVLPKEVLQ